jgi:hypothetical protein
MAMHSLRVGTRHGGNAADALDSGVGVFADTNIDTDTDTQTKAAKPLVAIDSSRLWPFP